MSRSLAEYFGLQVVMVSQAPDLGSVTHTSVGATMKESRTS